MNDIKDFTSVKNFPGTLDNEFDVVLRRFDRIEAIPTPFFLLILLIIAMAASYGRWSFGLALWAFFLLDWLLIAQLPRTGRSFGPPKPPVLFLAILRVPFALLPLPATLVLQVIGTILVVYGFWIEPHRLVLTHQRLESTKLPVGFTLKLLHLGDLHVERITSRERALNQMIRDLKPDLILFSGDVLNLSYVEDPLAIEQARQVIQEWSAPLGVYGVSGSEAVDLAHIFPNLIAGLPMQWLREDTLTLTHKNTAFSLTGLSCSHRPFRDAPVLENLSTHTQHNFSILLYHSPDLAPEAARLGYDLQLSGHTHGGQVCLPFYGPFFTASLYGRRFQSGRYHLPPLTLYITRGIGMEGKAAPRVRFLCSPEIILWEITGANPSANQKPQE